MNLDDRSPMTLRTAAVAALALVLATFGLVACSSDSDADGASKGDTAGESQGNGSAADDDDSAVDDDSVDDGDSGDDGDDTSGSGSGLDADWPEVPMPDFDKVTGGSSGDNYWNALLIVDPMMGATGDEMLSAYRTELEGADFIATAEDGPEFLSYENDSYLIETYSPSDGMLSVTVSLADD